MAQVKPNPNNFVWWWPLQEASGSRYDKIGTYEMTDNNTVTQAAGHVETYAAQFVRANDEFLSIADAAWNTFGNESICMWAWNRPASFDNPNTVFSKYNDSNDREYAGYYQSNDRPTVGIARGGHVWETEVQSAAGVHPVDTWYLLYYEYDAVADLLKVQSYDTAGALVAGNTGANATGFGTSVDAVTLQIGANEPGGAGSANYFGGRIEQFACYQGLLTADELLWVINGGAGRSYADLIGGQQPTWWLFNNWEKEAARLFERNRKLKQPIGVPA